MKTETMKNLLLAGLTVFVAASGSLAVMAEETETDDSAIEEEIVVIEKKDERVTIPRGYGSSRIRDWYVLDNRNIIIEVSPKTKYKATFMSACHGIRFTDTIGLSTMGPFELDKSTTVILPDGQRCHIKELVLYTAEMEQQDKKQKTREKEEKPEAD